MDSVTTGGFFQLSLLVIGIISMNPRKQLGQDKQPHL